MARLFGTAGSQMRTVAIGWQMYELTGSAWGLGLVGLYQFVAALLFTLVAGHVADRVHRGRIIATCILMQAVVAGTLVVATVGQGASGPWVSRGVLLGVSVMLGLTRAFQMPAQQALTPSLLPPQLLPSGLAFSSAGIQCAIIAGPAIGGLLFLAGASVVCATCTLIFGVAGFLLLRLRYAHVPPPTGRASLRSLLAGVAYVWERKILLGAVSLDLFAVLPGSATALLPMFARDILQVGPSSLGLLRAAPAVGALCMSGVLTLAIAEPGRPHAADGGGLVRLVHGGMRPVGQLLVVAAGPGHIRCCRYRECGGAPDPGATGDPGRHARSGQCRQLGVHRRQQPARRVRVGRYRRVVGPGALGGVGWGWHAADRRWLDAPVAGAGAARPAGTPGLIAGYSDRSGEFELLQAPGQALQELFGDV